MKRPPFFNAIVQTYPAFEAALFAHESGNLERAQRAYLKLTGEPELTAVCLHQLALIATAKNNHQRANALFCHALQIDPGFILAHQNLSTNLINQGAYTEAEVALVNLGCILQTQGHNEDAIKVYQNVLTHKPLNYAAQINLGTLLAWADKLPEAIRHLLSGIQVYGRIVPDIRLFIHHIETTLKEKAPDLLLSFDLPEGSPSGCLEKIEDALTTLGKALSHLGFHKEAVECHHQAIQCAPGYALGHWNLALALLTQGDFKTGWQEYEWRWHWKDMPEPRRLLPIPVWQGEPLKRKRILIWGEQGSGDIIQFTPLLQKLMRQQCEVVYEVPIQLVRLMQHNLSNITVISRPDHPHTLTTTMSFDYMLPLMSLPYRLKLSQKDLPLAECYISAYPQDIVLWAERIPPHTHLKVGITWAGNPRHAENSRRSIPFKLFHSILNAPNINLYSLQVGASPEDLPQALTDLAPYLKDFADTAAAIHHLDLIITVDTGVAHLAAAMGKPTWLLLPKVSDWRWGFSTTDTPWYNTIHIFRQTTTGQWDDVIQRVLTQLKAYPQ